MAQLLETIRPGKGQTGLSPVLFSVWFDLVLIISWDVIFSSLFKPQHARRLHTTDILRPTYARDERCSGNSVISCRMSHFTFGFTITAKLKNERLTRGCQHFLHICLLCNRCPIIHSPYYFLVNAQGLQKEWRNVSPRTELIILREKREISKKNDTDAK